MISTIFKRCLTMRLVRNKIVFPERHLSFLGGTGKRLRVAYLSRKRALFVVDHANITHLLISKGITDPKFYNEMGLQQRRGVFRTVNLLRENTRGMTNVGKRWLIRGIASHHAGWNEPKKSCMTNLFNIKAY